jgi:4-hydroxythreonine-4-phosphate dehydrogenase
MPPPRIGITTGDPAGIGPEIVARAIAEGALSPLGRFSIFAEAELFDRALRAAGLGELPEGMELAPVDCGRVPADFSPGVPSAFTGKVAARAVEAAASAALEGAIDAVVTAPLSKVALRRAGIPHPGHTEFLAALCGSPVVRMMFVARGIRLTLATIHVPLAEVPSAITAGGVFETLRLTREALVSREGISGPRIAVLGLNPHAGEGGLFGREEADVLEPAVSRAADLGWAVRGPFPADSFFLRRLADFDAVVAMYHDQGLIPVKLLAGGRAVNVTLGLPFVRTSVDHGTAFDIAGKGIASPESLVEAARLAARWSRAPAARSS